MINLLCLKDVEGERAVAKPDVPTPLRLLWCLSHRGDLILVRGTPDQPQHQDYDVGGEEYLTFAGTRSNLGGGMDAKSGVFTVPQVCVQALCLGSTNLYDFLWHSLHRLALTCSQFTSAPTTWRRDFSRCGNQTDACCRFFLQKTELIRSVFNASKSKFSMTTRPPWQSNNLQKSTSFLTINKNLFSCNGNELASFYDQNHDRFELDLKREKSDWNRWQQPQELDGRAEYYCRACWGRSSSGSD